MASQPLSESVMRATLAAVRNHGSVAAAARALGLPRGTMDNRWNRTKQWAKAKGIRLPEQGKQGVRPNLPVEGLTVKGDTAELNQRTTARVRTLADLVRVCEIDTTEWEIDRWTCNKWDMGSVPPVTGNDKDGWRRDRDTPVVTELYQVKVWLKRRAGIAAARAEIVALLDDAKRRVTPRAPFVAKRTASGNLLEPSIPDLHVGKLAWAKETGWENYDGKIAERIFEDALAVLIRRTESFRCERILLPVGNDILHSDTKQGTTTGGTPLDMDSRYHKSFSLVRRMMTRAIDTLRAIAPVHVIVVPGNHDTLSAWHLGDSLECYFHRCKDVTIDNAPSMRKYYQWGKVMLMLTHGNKGKLQDYPQVMAAEQRRMWGETIHREAHTGDKHQLRVQEYHGVRVRISPALCPPDAWHSEHHFVGNARAAEAFVFNRDEGLIGTANYTVPAPRRESAA